MRMDSSVGAAKLLSRAANVNPKNQEYSAAVASAGTPPALTLSIPDRSMLGAFVLDDLYRRACFLPFTSAVSDLAGVHQLVTHQPDLQPFAAALALIVRGEAVLLALRDELDGADPAFDDAFDAPFPEAIRQLGDHLRLSIQPAFEHGAPFAAFADIERGVATMQRFASYIAAQ